MFECCRTHSHAAARSRCCTVYNATIGESLVVDVVGTANEDVTFSFYNVKQASVRFFIAPPGGSCCVMRHVTRHGLSRPHGVFDNTLRDQVHSVKCTLDVLGTATFSMPAGTCQ